MLDPIVSFGIGGSGSDPATRCVNRNEFNPGGGGWLEFVNGHVYRAMQLGALRIMFKNPWGEIPGPMQASAFIDAQKGGFSLLTENFVLAMERAWEFSDEILIYTGGLLNDSQPKSFSNITKWFKPIWDCGASHVLDGDSIALSGTITADACQMMQAMRPDIPQYVEAMWGLHSSWCWDRPAFVLETTYQNWKASGFASFGVKYPTGSMLYRIIDLPGSNDVQWWRDTGIKLCHQIYHDGHTPCVNGDVFVDGGIVITSLVPGGPSDS